MTTYDITLSPQGGNPTMSSREIAELTGKQHKHVLADIRKMLGDLKIQPAEFSARYLDAKGEARECFNLPKRESLILVSGYSVDLRARIIDRWEALESGKAEPIGAPPRGVNPALIGREARLQFRMGLSVAKMLGLTGNQAALSANGLALRTTGVDVLEAMGQKRLVAPQQEVLLTATDIGRELGGKSAISVNSMLEAFGFQVGGRDHKHRTYWEPTALGLRAGAVMLDVERANKSGNSRQLRWASSIIDVLRELEAA